MGKRRTPQEKARIVLEFLNTDTSAAELYRNHGVSLSRSKTGGQIRRERETGFDGPTG